MFVMTLSQQKKVERYWEARSTEAEPQLAGHYQTRRTTGSAKRRDDLTGVGAPMQPTRTPYPICREMCTHQDGEGQTFLLARGGCMTCPTRKQQVPMHWWVCQSCGSRWQRTALKEPKEQKEGTPLQPTLTHSSGLITSVKRPATEPLPSSVLAVSIASDPDRDAEMRTVGE